MFSVGSVFATTFRIWVRNVPRFVLIAVLCYSPVIAFYQLLRIPAVNDFVQRHYYQPVWGTHSALLNVTAADWIAYLMIYATIAACVIAQLRSERIGVFRGLGRALRRGGSLLGAGLIHHLATIGVIVVVVMCIWSRHDWMWVGSSRLYGWALWAALWVVLHSQFYVFTPVVVIEQRGPLSAIARNFRLARGNRFKVIAIVLLVWVMIAGLNYVLFQLMLHDLDAYRRNYEIYSYVRLGLELVFATLSATATAVTYEQLREAKEGPTPDALDRVFA